MQDHINTFNQLVSQLLNANGKLSDEEKALLLLLHFLRSIRIYVKIFSLGGNLSHSIKHWHCVRENDKFMEIHDGEDKKGNNEALFGESSKGRAK